MSDFEVLVGIDWGTADVSRRLRGSGRLRRARLAVGGRRQAPAAETNAVLNAPDLNAGVALIRSRDTRLPTPT